MLLSNSNSNESGPISSLDQPFLQRPLDDGDHLHFPISSFLFPSPFEDDVFLPPHQELFLRHPQQSTNSIPKSLPSLSTTNQKVAQSSQKDHQIQRRRSSDRHSKINTLKGPRDRRMRLSLQVARDLFGLQDMLGVDKASKTIEWLLTQSKASIQKLEKELYGSEMKRSSSPSEGEVVSGIHEDHAIEGNQPIVKKANQNVRTKQPKKLAFQPLTKESREKARARARARTEKKQQSERLIATIDDDPDRYNEKSSFDFTRIGSSSFPLRTGEESGGTQSNVKNPCLDVLAEIDEPASSDSVPQKLDQTVEDSSIMTEHWSPSSIFSSLHSNEIYPQEYEFEEFPLIGKSWNFYVN